LQNEKEFYEKKVRKLALENTDRFNAEHGLWMPEDLTQKVSFIRPGNYSSGINFEIKAGVGLFGTNYGHAIFLNDNF
jgi:hypothetical protein